MPPVEYETYIINDSEVSRLSVAIHKASALQISQLSTPSPTNDDMSG